MKARMTSARLAIIGYGTLTLLASVTISACSGGSPPSAGASLSPGATATGTPSPGASDTATDTATPSDSATPSDTATASASPSPSPSPSPQAASPFPTVAPATGGGGTAGLQDVLLFVLGGAAVLVGAGSLAYRRMVVKNR